MSESETDDLDSTLLYKAVSVNFALTALVGMSVVNQTGIGHWMDSVTFLGFGAAMGIGLWTVVNND